MSMPLHVGTNLLHFLGERAPSKSRIRDVGLGWNADANGQAQARKEKEQSEERGGDGGHAKPKDVVERSVTLLDRTEPTDPEETERGIGKRNPIRLYFRFEGQQAKQKQRRETG